MMTEVCSLRDRGEPEDRDVLCTRPGPWGNVYTVHRWGMLALDKYRTDLRKQIADANMFKRVPGLQAWVATLRDLAGKRLLCACPADSLACHAWILAEEVARLTGVPVKPAPGRERT